MSTDSPKTPETVPSPRPATGWPLRIALSGTGLLAVAAIALFLAGIPLPGDFLRTRLEGVLTEAFGVPTRIEGPLHLRTGLNATIGADALILADPRDPAAGPLARGTQPVVSISLGALLRGTVRLDEVAAENIALRVERMADGRSNWDPVFAPRTGNGAVTFAGIDRLRIGVVEAAYLAADRREPLHVEIAKLNSTLAGETAATTQGTVRLAGRTIGFSVTSAPLMQLIAPGAAKPIRAHIGLAGARITVDGRYLPVDRAVEATLEVAAPDADALIAATGLASHDAGSLAASGKVRVTPAGAEVSNLDLRIGESDVSGSMAVNWAGERPRLVFELIANRLDDRPFTRPPDTAQEKTDLETAIDILDRAATTMDLEAKLTIVEHVHALSDFRDVRIESRIAGRSLTMKSQARIWGMNVAATLAYDARGSEKMLSARFEGSRFSTKAVTAERLYRDVQLTAGTLRGDLQGRGESPKALAASLRGKVDAKDLHASWPRTSGGRADARLASARLELGGGKPVLAEVNGRLGDRTCALTGRGGPLAPLIAGERWPVRLDLTCQTTRVSAKGHVVAAGSTTTGEAAFSLRADDVRNLAALAGLQSGASLPVAMQGQLQLAPDTVRVAIGKATIGRTAGSGSVTWSLAGHNAHNKISLALSTADADQLLSLAAGTPRPKQSDILTRAILPSNFRLPDADFDVSAASLRIGGETVRKLRIEAAPRDGKLASARFAFDWNGIPVSGDLAADFRSTRPSIGLNFTAENVDFGGPLSRVGRKQAGVRAAKVTARADSAGVRVDELLASMTIEAALTGGRIEQVQHLIPGLAGHGEFIAKLSVTAGRPVSLEVRGRAATEPLEITLETGGLSELMRQEGELPAKLRAALGKTRFEGAGRFRRDGTGNGHVTLAADRLDYLGRLLGFDLPPVGPYAASCKFTATADSISATNIDLSIGKSRLLGTVSIRRGAGRRHYQADLRAPVLHIEDLGLRISDGGAAGTADAGPSARDARVRDTVRRYVNVLRSFDAQTRLEVEDLRAAGTQATARSQITMGLKDGDLRLTATARQKEGSATVDVRVDARTSPPRVRIRAQAEEFEFGTILTALNPRLKSEGKLHLALDLTTRTLSPPLSDAQGHMEIAIYPRGLRLGTARLWGLGVLGFVQSTLDPGAESTLNCSVAFWNVKDGVARTEGFFADTTHVRVIGNIELQLPTGRLSGGLTPRAKNPQLFSVDPAVKLSGTIDDPKATMMGGSLITAPLQFFTPFHLFALDWLRRVGDSELGCREAFEKSKAARAKPAAQQPSP